ncbi:MAG: DUF3108 domain-containing protein [Endomicrobiia bacterium]
MFKKFIESLFLVFFFKGCLISQIETYLEDANLFLQNSELRDIGTYYMQSEIFRYKIYWEFLYAGDAEMGLLTDELYNKKFYLIFTKTTSNKSLDLIYKVRNKTVSYVDYKGFYSLKFFSEQNEAGKEYKEYVIFDYNNSYWKETISDTTGYISNFLQDVVSALWWLRLQQLDVGKQYEIQVYSGKVIYPMKVDVLNLQKIKIFDKEYTCFKIEPKVDLKKFPLFKARGKLFVYITNDEKKLPVRLESRVIIGRVFADLVEKN